VPSWIANEPKDVPRRAARWLAEPALGQVVRAFGFGESLDPEQLAAWSAAVLDTRQGHERREAPPVDWDTTRVKAVVEAAGQLGLMVTDWPALSAYTTTVILGGAATGNRLRTQLVRDLQARGVDVGTVVLLASNRPISPSEHATDPESADDTSEWMHLLRCVDDFFGPLEPTVEASKREASDIWRDDTFTGAAGTAVRLVVAEDRVTRRPTTLAAVRFLMNRSDAAALSPVLVVTSAIYVPYQFFAAVPAFLSGGVRPVEVIGTPTSIADERLLAQRLGQELHAAITWAVRLIA
jgi:hypothetical protein